METVQDPKTGRWKAKEPFKRYWQAALWEEFFDTYLNIENCHSIPSISQFRAKFEQYLLSDPQKAKSIKVALCRQGIMLSDFLSKK
jgi:hypothetical protein